MGLHLEWLSRIGDAPPEIRGKYGRQLGEGPAEWSCKEQRQLQGAPKLGGARDLEGLSSGCDRRP